jgi:hypothetical protein
MASVSLGSGYRTGVKVLVTTSSGNIYAFFVGTDYYTLEIRKSTNGGVSFSSLSSVSDDTVFGTGAYPFYGVAVAIDSSDIIHVACQSQFTAATRDISYATLTTSNDSWSSWEQAAAMAIDLSNPYACSIAVDSNDKPHIVYIYLASNMGNDYSRIYYTNKVSGWLTPEMVSTGTQTNYASPNIVVRGSNIVEVTYDTAGVSYYRVRTSGSWGSETSFTGHYQYPFTATTGGTVYRYSGAFSTPYGVYENGTQFGSGTIDAKYGLQAATSCLVGSTRFFLYVDQSDNDLKYSKNDGSGWIAPVTLYIGTFTVPAAEWAYYNEHQGQRVNYLYLSSGTVYYDYISLEVTSTKTVYTKGKVSSSSNKSSYMYGLGNKPTFTKILFRVPSQSGTPCTGSKPTYLKGRILNYPGSKSAFLLAQGKEGIIPDGYISSSGIWKDSSDGNTTIYQKIDEYPQAIDTDWIKYYGTTDGDYVEFSLNSPVHTPSGGDVLVFFRAKDMSGSSAEVTIQLRQDSTVIASIDKTLTIQAQTYSFTLTSGEKSNITNWNNLRIRIIAKDVP